MKLKEMIDLVGIPCFVKLRNSDNEPICDFDSNSKGILPYADLEIVEWFVYNLENNKNTICVLVNTGEEE